MSSMPSLCMLCCNLFLPEPKQTGGFVKPIVSHGFGCPSEPKTLTASEQRGHCSEHSLTSFSPGILTAKSSPH